MTATEVNGVDVVSDEPTQAPMNMADGRPIVWTQTRTLVLKDGSVVYGCQHCDYTSPNILSIRPHLNKHRTRGSSTSRRSDDVSLNQLLRRLSELDAIESDRDKWRRRALDAEHRLRTLRKALAS